MNIKIATLFSLSLIIFYANAFAESTICPNQTVGACGSGVGTNRNTTSSLKDAKESATNEMNEKIYALCQNACKDLPGSEQSRCISLRFNIEDKFSSNKTLNFDGPDIAPDGSLVNHTVKVSRGDRSPQKANIAVDPANTLTPPANIAAYSCTEATCICKAIPR